MYTFCSDLPGNSDIVKNDFNGVIAEAGSASSYSKSILKIFKNPDFFREVGIRGRKTITKNHNISKVGEKLERVYRKILQDG